MYTFCDQCKKHHPGLQVCFLEEKEIQLCPDCAREHYCVNCGHFSSGTQSFDIIHPGWCDDCYEEEDQDDSWPTYHPDEIEGLP